MLFVQIGWGMVLLFSALGISWMLQNQVKDILGRLVGKEVLLQEKTVSMEYGPGMFILVLIEEAK